MTWVLFTRRFLGDSRPMRLAIISDIHGNIAALEAVLDDIQTRNVEGIVNLGDVLSGPLDAVGTANRLMPMNIPTVSGNHDRQLFDRPKSKMGLWESWVIDDLTAPHIAWVQSFSTTIRHGDVVYCHATPDSDAENWLDFRGPDHRLIARELPGVAERLGETRASVICCGHTHAPRVVRLPGGPLVVNPGAVGVPAYFDDRTDPPFIQQTGAPDARYAILDETPDGWRAELITLPYDCSEMAGLARAKGAESWARALETGWIV